MQKASPCGPCGYKVTYSRLLLAMKFREQEEMLKQAFALAEISTHTVDPNFLFRRSKAMGVFDDIFFMSLTATP